MKSQNNSNYATFNFFFSFEHSDLLKLLIRLIQKMEAKRKQYAGVLTQNSSKNDPTEVLSSSSQRGT